MGKILIAPDAVVPFGLPGHQFVAAVASYRLAENRSEAVTTSAIYSASNIWSYIAAYESIHQIECWSRERKTHNELESSLLSIEIVFESKQ